MFVTSTRGANRVSRDGTTYEPHQGFVFDLPQDLAEHLLSMSDAHGPLWRVPVQEDYDLPDEAIAQPEPTPRKRAEPRKAARPAPKGVPGPDVTGQ